MIRVEIPRSETLCLETLILDFNGTIALDGELIQSVKDSLLMLSERLEIHILTSDTFGTVIDQCKNLPVKVRVLKSQNHSNEKASYVANIGPNKVVAIGNGANDKQMFEVAKLGIAVIGLEGCSVSAFQSADILVTKVEDALGLLLYPKRLVATLRH